METYPVSFSCPPRMPTDISLSRGDPKGMNCRSFASRKSRLVVSSKRFVIWSTESGVPYFEFFNFSGGESENNVADTNGNDFTL